MRPQSPRNGRSIYEAKRGPRWNNERRCGPTSPSVQHRGGRTTSEGAAPISRPQHPRSQQTKVWPQHPRMLGQEQANTGSYTLQAEKVTLKWPSGSSAELAVSIKRNVLTMTSESGQSKRLQAHWQSLLKGRDQVCKNARLIVNRRRAGSLDSGGDGAAVLTVRNSAPPRETVSLGIN